jgi:WD40 repeat protein
MSNTRSSRLFHLSVETQEMYGAFSPDRSRLLTGGDGPKPKVHIWDVQTGNCLQTLSGHKSLSRLSPGRRTDAGWLRVRSINACVSGM